MAAFVLGLAWLAGCGDSSAAGEVSARDAGGDGAAEVSGAEVQGDGGSEFFGDVGAEGDAADGGGDTDEVPDVSQPSDLGGDGAAVADPETEDGAAADAQQDAEVASVDADVEIADAGPEIVAPDADVAGDTADDTAPSCDGPAACPQAGTTCAGSSVVTCAPDADGCLVSTTQSCDDGLDCTSNACVDGVCVSTPVGTCAWPAEPIIAAQNLTGIEGPIWDNDFYENLSGAVWDPVAETLWVCRNASPSKVWALVDDGAGGMMVAMRDGKRGEWSDFGDAEGITVGDYGEPDTVYIMAEGIEHIREYDMSTYGNAVLKNDWDIQAATATSGGSGSEGITFVPDEFLAAQGFVDASGAPYVSTLGMGGLMFVGHQNGGHIYVFDLDRATGAQVFVGKYATGATETAGLEFDRSTGLLFIWHGGSFNTLEVARLGSNPADPTHRLNTVRIYESPGSIPLITDNHEGIALTSNAACDGGNRSLFLTTDGASAWSLLRFNQFPCE